SPRSVTVSILAGMPSTDRCSSVNRMVPCPSRSMTYIDHLSPTRCSTARARQLVGPPAVPVSLAAPDTHAASGSPAGPDGLLTGPACPESTTSPPRYLTRLLRGSGLA